MNNDADITASENADLLDSVGYVDPRLIDEADGYLPERKAERRVIRAAIAACLCLAVAGAGFAAWHIAHRSEGVNEDVKTPEAAVAEPTEGVYIPAVELPKNTEGVAMDMIGLVVYRGGIYTQGDSFAGADAERIDPLVGEHLGYATGSIDEWSTQEDYAEEFASSVPGDVYAVSGYDPDFRICIRNEYEDENGEPALWIDFLERLNGVTLGKGSDLFEDRLHIRGNIQRIQWQSHDDWNWARGNIRDAQLDPALWESFLDEVNAGEFVNEWHDSADNTIYDTPNQVHIILDMNDGTTVRLRLIEGGYVGYEPLGWYFVRIPGETFDAVFATCSE